MAAFGLRVDVPASAPAPRRTLCRPRTPWALARLARMTPGESRELARPSHAWAALARAIPWRASAWWAGLDRARVK